MRRIIDMFAVAGLLLLAYAEMLVVYNPYVHGHVDRLDRWFSGFRFYRRIAHCDWRFIDGRWVRSRAGVSYPVETPFESYSTQPV